MSDASTIVSAEALLALGLGIIVGPIALDWFSPFTWAGSQEKTNVLTFESEFKALDLTSSHTETDCCSKSPQSPESSSQSKFYSLVG